MPKELVIIYDAPATNHNNILEIHNLSYYLKYFNRIRVVYWAEKKEGQEIFETDNGRFIFYPYTQPYNSSYFTGVRFMFWIYKTLEKICKDMPKGNNLILMPVIPIWAGLPTLFVGKLRGKKIILRLEASKIDYLMKEGLLEGYPKIFTFLKISILKLIYYLTLPLYDFVIAISEGIQKEALHYGAKKTVKIPIPVNIRLFLDLKRTSKQKPVILYVGQIKKIKGVDLLIKTLGILKNEKKIEAKILIAGDVTNPKDKPFFQEIKKNSKDLDVEFLGWIHHKKLPEIYAMADIFVLLSFSEALGMTIMEAMAAGLPIVASRTAGAIELLRDGQTGFLVEPGNIGETAEKIAILFRDSDLRKKMGQEGRKRVKEIIEKVNEDNKRLWEQIL